MGWERGEGLVVLLALSRGVVGVAVPDELLGPDGLLNPFISRSTLSATRLASASRFGVGNGCEALAADKHTYNWGTNLLNILV
jgi:hypothetical protein